MLTARLTKLVHREVDKSDCIHRFLIGHSVVVLAGVFKLRVHIGERICVKAPAVKLRREGDRTAKVKVEVVIYLILRRLHVRADEVPGGASGDDVAVHLVVGLFVADVDVERAVEQDVIVHLAVKAFAQLDAHAEAEVVVDLIIRRTVVKVDAPGARRFWGVVEPVVVNGGGADVIDPGEIIFYAVHRIVAQQITRLTGGVVSRNRPEPVAAPRVERAVVARLALRVVDVVVGDFMAAEGPVVYVDVGACALVNRVVQDVHPGAH